MQLHLLHLDQALKLQTQLMQYCLPLHAMETDAQETGAKIRLWGRWRHLKQIKEKLPRFANDNPAVTVMGSGDFHHVTALLLDRALEQELEAITVVQFDNHPDWVKFNDGLHCGSWVDYVLKNPKISKVVTVGVCSDDLKQPERKRAQLNWLQEGKLALFPYQHPPSQVKGNYNYFQYGKSIHWPNMIDSYEDDFLAQLIQAIPTQNIYVTIDKDVLLPDIAQTNWDQGQMTLSYLCRLLTHLGQQRNIIGADIIGDYSPIMHKGNLMNRLLKYGEAWLDQPRRKPKGDIANLNANTNIILLNTLTAVMH